MNKIERSAPGALDAKVAAALDDSKPASSDDLEILVDELDAAIEESDRDAQRERDKSLDPTIPPTDGDEAHSRAVLSELRRDRYKSARGRIEQRLREALQDEYAQRWDADYSAREREEQLLAKEFTASYQEILNKFPDLGRRIEACDRESDRVNAAAPEGEMRRLRGVEATARGRAGFGSGDPSILQTVQLPSWKHASTMVWPEPKIPFGVSYVQSMTFPAHSMGVGGIVGPDWEKPEMQQRFRELKERERARQSAYYQRETEQQEERVNREAREQHTAAKRRA